MNRFERAISCATVLPGMIAALFASGVPAAGAAAEGVHYHLIKTVTLGGTEFWDYLGIDPEARRVFITRGNHVMVVDADSGALVGDIQGLGGIHGVVVAGDRGYISDGGTNSVVVFDRRTLQKTGSIPVGMRPDGILYDPFSRRVFSFNGGSQDATAIDVATGQVAGTVPLGGRPEAAASDQHGTIYVNIEDKDEIAAFDSKTLAPVQRRWPLAPCTGPSGIAIDVAHQRLFSGCRNSVMAVSDTVSGKVVTTVPIGQGVDANRFDPDQGLVFSSNGGSGTLTVVRRVAPNDYQVVQNVPTARSARTLELDPRTHRIYLVAADFKPFAAPKGAAPPKATTGKAGGFRRPAILPDSFRLLILSP